MSERKPAHVVVFGNEKGGSGKSTLAMHVITGLLRAGYSVASADLDIRQRSLTRFLENRHQQARRRGLSLRSPAHAALQGCAEGRQTLREEREFAEFAEAVSWMEYNYDFLVLDTPGSDSYLCRLGHAMADTLVTPVNDSFIDFDVIARRAGQGRGRLEASQYSRMVAKARRKRREADGGEIDWIVVRNRLSSIQANNKLRVGSELQAASSHIGYRTAEGFGERVIYRELFPRGLTLFDVFDRDSGVRPTMSHVSARHEVRRLIDALRLPTGKARRLPAIDPLKTSIPA